MRIPLSIRRSFFQCPFLQITHTLVLLKLPDKNTLTDQYVIVGYTVPFFFCFALSLSSVPRYEFEFSLSPYNSQTKISSHLFRELSPAACSSVPRDITLAIVDKATLAVQHKRHLVAPLCRKKAFPILILWVGGQAATARSAYKSFTQRIFHQPAHPRKQISMSNTHQQQVAVYKKKKLNESVVHPCTLPRNQINVKRLTFNLACSKRLFWAISVSK